MMGIGPRLSRRGRRTRAGARRRSSAAKTERHHVSVITDADSDDDAILADVIVRFGNGQGGELVRNDRRHDCHAASTDRGSVWPESAAHERREDVRSDRSPRHKHHVPDIHRAVASVRERTADCPSGDHRIIAPERQRLAVGDGSTQHDAAGGRHRGQTREMMRSPPKMLRRVKAAGVSTSWCIRRRQPGSRNQGSGRTYRTSRTQSGGSIRGCASHAS